MALRSVRTVRRLQEERVSLHAAFEEGFKGYVAAAPNFDFETFRKLVHEISMEFQRVSHLIICERDALSVFGKDELAKIVGKVQEKESEKLELTAAYQIARQTRAEMEASPRKATTLSGSGDAEMNDLMTRREIEDLKRRIAANAEDINELLEELKYESEDLYLEEGEEEEMEVREVDAGDAVTVGEGQLNGDCQMVGDVVDDETPSR